jgi:hypothetical protein
MTMILDSIMLLCLIPPVALSAQIIAGSPEEKLLQRIMAETSTEIKLQMLIDSQYTRAQWKDYLENTEGAVRNILGYVQAVRGIKS